MLDFFMVITDNLIKQVELNFSQLNFLSMASTWFPLLKIVELTKIISIL